VRVVGSSCSSPDGAAAVGCDRAVRPTSADGDPTDNGSGDGIGFPFGGVVGPTDDEGRCRPPNAPAVVVREHSRGRAGSARS
jgi:hypothetical protein